MEQAGRIDEPALPRPVNALRRWATLVVCVVLVLIPRVARANGAFPDSQGILTPVDRSEEILLATNFGLVTSQDSGRTWLWSCERDANLFGYLYQYGPSPRHRLFALSGRSLIYSDDQACGWNVAGGAVTNQYVADAFPDPVDANRVLAASWEDAKQIFRVLRSNDGGTTFDTVLYTGAPNDVITGLEISRSDPATIYLTLSRVDSSSLVRSTDGGQTWDTTDLSATLGPGILRIIAVDPQNPQKVFLRHSRDSTEALAVTVDGGATATTPLVVDGVLIAFARATSGAILIGSGGSPATAPLLWRSEDGGMNWQTVPNPPHIRGLSQRDGVVYAATDNVADGYAVATSIDEGTTWKGVLSYNQVQAIVPCLKVTCQIDCLMQASLQLWPVEMCSVDPAVAPVADAGAESADASPSACRQTSSRGCQIASTSQGCSGLAVCLVLLAGTLRRRSARHRRGG